MEKNINALFWNASIEEIKQGYIGESTAYRCIICGEDFTKGEIFSINEKLYDAKKAVELHIVNKHHSMLEYMMQMNRSFLGLTDIQKDFLQCLINSEDDKAVASKMGIHPSTVRNHKYRLREKEKQAKLFLALMQLVEGHQKEAIEKIGETKLHEISKTANMVDDRYNTTQAEKDKIIASYFNEVESLKEYPAKAKRKIIVLEKISTHFNKGRTYTEEEINRILMRVYDDYVLLRRALIEYGFMERDKAGNKYWLKE